MSFTHLHLHTLYSLLDGAIRMKDLIKTVKAKGMSAVAVTDHGNMFGAIDFYKKAKDAGIKPILGMEAYVAGTKGRTDRTEKVANHLILLAKNEEGYANLRLLSSKAYLDGFYYHPRIDKQLLAEHSGGLFGLTACLGGEVTSACFRGDMDAARSAAREYKDIFAPGHFFLEIQSNGLPEQEKANANLKQLSRDVDLPLVATADAHYIQREDAAAHELLMAIASGKTLADSKRMRHSTDQLYVTSPEEMLAYFHDVPEAVHNTMRIAEQCTLELKLGKPMLPTFKVPEGHTPDSYMAELATTGPRGALQGAPLPGGPGAVPPPARHRAGRHLQHGVQRLLPHRPGLHQLGEAARHPGGAGARLRRGEHRRLRAAHHRPGPHPLQPPLRAVPQPRAGVDAGLRHRLLSGPPRRGHHLRLRQVRSGQRRANHHLRLAEGEERAP